MSIQSRSFLTVLLFAVLTPLVGAQSYQLGGPASNYSSHSWCWDGGTYVAPMKTAIDDASNFGVGGVVGTDVQLSSLSSIDAASLAGLDGFVAPYWRDTNAPDAEVLAIVEFFLNGGDLFLLDDSSSYDKIADWLGIPTFAHSDGSPSDGGAPLCDGPFGLAASVEQRGTTGQLSAADIAAVGGSVGAANGSGEITAAWWDDDSYAPGAGRLVIFADVDMAASTTADYATMDENARFTLNAVAWLVDGNLDPSFIIAGPDSSLAPSSGEWAWDGVHLAPLRSALEDPDHFGPFGTIETTIQTRDLATVDATSLASVDVMVVPYWADADSSSNQVSAVMDWFLAGGDLVLLQDDKSHDEVGQNLGIPTRRSSNGTVSDGSAPYFTGPFGQATSVRQFDITGQLDFADLALTNGTVGGLNRSAQVTCAYWHPGQYAPGAGSLLVIADVDMITDLTADYAGMNDNAVFALNALSYSVEQSCDGTVTHYGSGCPGSGGFVPRHALVGCPDRGRAISLRITDGLGGALARVAIGLSGRASIPFGSCELLVNPPLFFLPITLSGSAGVAGRAHSSLPVRVPCSPRCGRSRTTARGRSSKRSIARCGSRNDRRELRCTRPSGSFGIAESMHGCGRRSCSTPQVESRRSARCEGR